MRGALSWHDANTRTWTGPPGGNKRLAATTTTITRSSVLFEDLWVRPRGKWLFPVHSYYPEVHDPRTSQGPVMYGPHIDPK